MKKAWKILGIILWVLLAAGAIFLAGFSYSEHNYSSCKKVVIKIDYGRSDTLITRHDIADIIRFSGIMLKDELLGYINCEKIEQLLRIQPYIANAQVFSTLRGDIYITIVQRKPILRIFTQKNESYYLDETGNLLPLNPAFSARVVVATGYIGEPYRKNSNCLQDSVMINDSLCYHSVMIHLYRMAIFLTGNRFLRAQIDQIFVDQSGELELYPRVGNHVILVGKTDNLEDKFERLLVFYQYGLEKTGWNKYKKINIKFKNQIVCSKI